MTGKANKQVKKVPKNDSQCKGTEQILKPVIPENFPGKKKGFYIIRTY